MSDKSRYTEDWAFVDKDGDIEISDDASNSSSSMELVNLEKDVVSYQSRKSSERSVNLETSPTETGSFQDDTLQTTSADQNMDFVSEKKTETSTVVCDDITDGMRHMTTRKSASDEMMSENAESLSRSLSNFTAIKQNSEQSEKCLNQELLPLSSSIESDCLECDSECIEHVAGPSGISDTILSDIISVAGPSGISDTILSDIISVAGPSGISTSSTVSSDVGDNNSEDSDFIRLEVTDSLDADSQSEDSNVMTSSSVSSRFSFMSRDNSPEEHVPSVDLLVVVPTPPPLPPPPPAHIHNEEQVDANRHGYYPDIFGNHGNQVDDEYGTHDYDAYNQSAEVEEDQDHEAESGNEDERIESDQSDAGSIPPMEDDMSFVNDIGDLPLVVGDTARQYVHNPNRQVNLTLDVIAILMFTVVVGLGIGHAIATFDEIDEFDSLQSTISSMRSSYVTCENERWQQTRSINEMRNEHENILQKYTVTRRELERLRMRNAELLKELKLKKTEEKNMKETEDIRLTLKNQINQLQIEKDELKQAIGQLKYMIHPANENPDVLEIQAPAKQSCDIMAADEKLSCTENGLKLSDCTLDDLAEIHDTTSRDNSFLKQEVGRLRYTRHPGNVEDVKVVVPSDTKNKTEEVDNNFQQNTTEGNDKHCIPVIEFIKMKKDLEIEVAEWKDMYRHIKSQKNINATYCLKYLLSNFTASQIISNLDSNILEDVFTASSSFARDVKSSVSTITNEIWDNISKTSEEILESFVNSDDEDEEEEDILDEDPSEPETETETEHSNETKENPETPQTKWSETVKDILNKTRNKMSNVSRQIQDTWLQVRNLSHQFWAEHEPTVTDTLNKVTDKISRFGNHMKSKIQRKINKWYKKSHKKSKNFQNSFESKASDKHQNQHPKNNKQDSNYKKNKTDFKKHNKKSSQRKHSDKNPISKKDKELLKARSKFLQKLRKYQHRISNSLDEYYVQRMTRHGRLAQWEEIEYMKDIVIQLGLNKLTEVPDPVIVWLECQGIFWNSVVWKNSPIDENVKFCTQYLKRWQMENILKIQRRSLEKDVVMDDDVKFKNEEKDYLKNHEDQYPRQQGKQTENSPMQSAPSSDWQFKQAKHREETRRQESDPDWLFDRANEREVARKLESEPDWIFDRANHREDIRHKESDPDWLFDRANEREVARKLESEPDWIFDRANHREDIRHKESEPDWLFIRAKHREDVRQTSDEESYNDKHVYRQRHPVNIWSDSHEYVNEEFFDYEQ